MKKYHTPFSNNFKLIQRNIHFTVRNWIPWLLASYSFIHHSNGCNIMFQIGLTVFLITLTVLIIMLQCYIVLGDPEVSANLYCNSRTSVLWKLRDDMRLLMGHLVGHASVNFCRVFYFYTPYQSKGLIIFIFLMITEIK